jgi:hypothetical protein
MLATVLTLFYSPSSTFLSMLDFYLIADISSKRNPASSDPDFLDGIDYEEFEELRELKIIEDHLDYYKDFRWTSDQVSSKLKLLDNLTGKKFRLAEILKKAKLAQVGIIAFGD